MANVSTIDVTALEEAARIEDGDTLLLIRQNEDGTQTCMKFKGKEFKGEDAYEVAVKNDYKGNYEDWENHVTQVAKLDVGFDVNSGCLVIDTGEEN